MYTYLHLLGDTTKEPCHVPFCRHREGAEGCDCEFFRFPLDRSRRNQWIYEIGAYGHLEKQPSYLSKICSCHFENGDSSKTPSIFPWTENPEKYDSSVTEKARLQISNRRAARQRAAALEFEAGKMKVEKDSIFCDSIVLHFDTSPITGKKDSSLISSGNISKCEMVTNNSIHNGVKTHTKPFEHKSTQTSVVSNAEVMLLKSELAELTKKMEKLSKKVFGVHMLRGKEEYFKYFTGVSEKMFNMFVTEIQKKDPDYRPKNLTLEDEILLTLMKLRLNTGYVDLTVRFSIPIASICPIITRHLDSLHSLLFVPMRNFVGITESGSKVELEALKTQPRIINCTNIVGEAIVDGSDAVAQKQTYKGNFKVVMGVTSNQIITYCSDVYKNNLSKEEIFGFCDLDKFIKPGDIIVKDRDHSLLERALKSDKRISEFLIVDLETFRNREHLCFGRVMKRLRNFQIIPFFPQSLFRLSTKIVQVCVALANYQNPHFWEADVQKDIETVTNSKEFVTVTAEHVEVVEPEEETEEVIVTDMDDDEVIEVETEMDAEF